MKPPGFTGPMSLRPLVTFIALLLFGPGAALLAVSSGTPSASAAPDPQFHLVRSKVSPGRFFFDSAQPARIALRFSSKGPLNLSVRIAGGGREVRRMAIKQAEPDTDIVLAWNGKGDHGDLASQGSYRFVVKAPRAPLATLGRLRLFHDFFPIRGPHRDRGYLGQFGDPRSGGRTHEGFDVNAACGTPLVAARGGMVAARGFDPVLHGNFILISARSSPFAYYYAHMKSPTPWKRGDRLHTGDRVGVVGRTGNAGSTPCHLHFEIRRHSRPRDPGPFLHAWDSWS